MDKYNLSILIYKQCMIILLEAKKAEVSTIDLNATEDGLHFVIEVDIERISISSFMARLSQVCEFTDISIKELPMDKIITHIYKDESETKATL